MKISLNTKLDELSKIGTLRQYTLDQKLNEYSGNDWPNEFKLLAINEAKEYAAKGMLCNEFTLFDGIESVTQWNKPSEFIKNCYTWFVKS